MRIYQFATAMVALGLVSASAHANNGLGFGTCRSGFANDTVVSTESRGKVTIAELRIDDRVWSFNEVVGKPGWSRVLRRVDAGPQYKILADFTEPGSSEVTKACWIIKPAG
ncbi:Hint domain-containing protein [Lysobacter fragariae]